MKTYIHTPFALCILTCLMFLLSSFSLVDAREDSREDNREDNVVISKQERRAQKKHLRLENRKSKLKNRLEKAQKSNKRQRLQKKIRGIDKEQEMIRRVSVWAFTSAVAAFIFGLIAFLALVLSNFVGGTIFLAFAILAILFAIIGLLFSFVGLKQSGPNYRTSKMLALIAMITCIVIFVALIASLLLIL